MLTAVGIAIIILVVGLLLSGRATPVVGLTLVPLAGALLAGFGIDQIGTFFTNGLSKVMPVAAMFMFAIVFFGVMQDAGLFQPVVRMMLAVTRGNVIAVAVGTALLGMIAHLDGAGATTFLLTVPALLPLYRRLDMNPYLMLMLLALGAGVLNMTPWAGPMGRASAVTGIDVTALWHPLIAIQAIGAVLLVLLAVLLGIRESSRVRADSVMASGDHRQTVSVEAHDGASLPRPGRLWLNCVIFATVLASLFSAILPAAYVFMIGLATALTVNYPSVAEQVERIKAHAPNALLMGSIILAAGAFLGIMDGSGMLKSMAQDLIKVLPEFVTPHLHLVLGAFGVPMELVLSTDAYYFGLLPIVREVVSGYGVSSAATVYALMVGNVIGTFVSPFSPALWLALGLANLEMGKHIRYSLLTMWGFSAAMLGSAVLLDRIPLV